MGIGCARASVRSPRLLCSFDGRAKSAGKPAVSRLSPPAIVHRVARRTKGSGDGVNIRKQIGRPSNKRFLSVNVLIFFASRHIRFAFVRSDREVVLERINNALLRIRRIGCCGQEEARRSEVQLFVCGVKKMRKAFVLLGLVAALGCTTVSAEIVVPHRIHPTIDTVSEVLASGKDEDWVMLTGALVRKERANEYVFRDATGEIKATVLSDVIAGHVLHADRTFRAVARVSRPPFETPTIDIERIDE